MLRSVPDRTSFESDPRRNYADELNALFSQGVLPWHHSIIPEGSKIGEDRVGPQKRPPLYRPIFVMVPDTLKRVLGLEKEFQTILFFPDTHGWAIRPFDYDAAVRQRF